VSRQGRATGHVRLRGGKLGPVWYARLRLPDGRQLHRRIGYAHEGKGRRPDGYLTERLAKEQLEELLVKARHGELPEQIEQQHAEEAEARGPTFRQAADDYLHYVELVKRADWVTVKDYRGVIDGYLLGEFDDRPVSEITDGEINAYKERLLEEGRLSSRSVVRHLVVLSGIFKRAKVDPNPARAEAVERPKPVYTGEYHAYEPEQVELLAAAALAAGERQDATLYRVAAFTGLRQGELLALRWSDVDLLAPLLHVRRNWSAAERKEKVPKGKRVRSVPMTSEVVDALARLKDARPKELAGDDALVFCTTVGGRLDSWALRRRFYRAVKNAGLPPLRFHDLRHSFGTLAVRVLDPYAVQSYMGHQHYSTTQRYLHHKPRSQDAAALERAFGGGDGDKPGGEPAATPDAEQDPRGL
jgi:integrase